jgi:Ca2+-binding EF-hand superfamily protein
VLQNWEATINEMLTDMDRNKSGEIDPEELASTLKRFGIRRSKAQIRIAIKDMDKNNDGFVSFTEFTDKVHSVISGGECDLDDFMGRTLQQLYLAEWRRMVMEKVQTFDDDRSGVISGKELADGLNAMGLKADGESFTYEELLKFVEIFDANGDGSCSVEEVYTGLALGEGSPGYVMNRPNSHEVKDSKLLDIANTVHHLMTLELKFPDLEGKKVQTNLYRELSCNREMLIPAAKWAMSQLDMLKERDRKELKSAACVTYLDAARILMGFQLALSCLDQKDGELKSNPAGTPTKADNYKSLMESIMTGRVDVNGQECRHEAKSSLPSLSSWSLSEAFRLGWLYMQMRDQIEHRISQRALLGKALRKASHEMTEYHEGHHFPLMVEVLTTQTSVVSILCDLCWDLMLLVKFQICRKIEDACTRCVDLPPEHPSGRHVQISCLCDNGWVKCEPQVCKAAIGLLCRQAFECVRNRNSIASYDTENALLELQRMQDRILVTYLRGANMSLLEQLKCCIMWNRDDLAKKFVLSAIPLDESERLTDPLLCDAFKTALVTGADKLVIPLFDAIQNLASFDPLDLYIDQLAEMREEASFCKGLQGAFFNKHLPGNLDAALPFEKVLQTRAMFKLVSRFQERFKMPGDVEGKYWRAQVAAMAERLDADGDDSVSSEELAYELVSIGFLPTKKELDATIRALDEATVDDEDSDSKVVASASTSEPAPSPLQTLNRDRGRRASLSSLSVSAVEGVQKCKAKTDRSLAARLRRAAKSIFAGRNKKGQDQIENADKGDGSLSPKEFRDKVCKDEKPLMDAWWLAKEKVRVGRDKLLFEMGLLDSDLFTVAIVDNGAKEGGIESHRRVKLSDLHKISRESEDETGREKANVADKLLYDLLVWAMLFNKLGAAKLIWARCSHPIETALVAASICKYLVRFPRLLDLGPEELESLKEGMADFQAIAVGVLSECYTRDPEDCTELLRSPLLRFPSDVTFADVAREQGLLKFLCHSSVQVELETRWTAPLVPTIPNWWLYLAIMAPMMLLGNENGIWLTTKIFSNRYIVEQAISLGLAEVRPFPKNLFSNQVRIV